MPNSDGALRDVDVRRQTSMGDYSAARIASQEEPSTSHQCDFHVAQQASTYTLGLLLCSKCLLVLYCHCYFYPQHIR